LKRKNEYAIDWGKRRDTYSLFISTSLLFSLALVVFIHYYHVTALPPQKNLPLGPLSGSVAAQTIPFALSCTGGPP
jgi:hypothetical protein